MDLPAFTPFSILICKRFEGAFCRDAAHIGFSKEFASSGMSERIYEHSKGQQKKINFGQYD